LFFLSALVIGYQFTQTSYDFAEVDLTTPICIEVVTGEFPPGGYITFELTTLPLTATGMLLDM
jgi:hypothetical protein